MKKQNEEKMASNFELNVIKLGKHTLQLEVGDRFESNGAYFHYVPKGQNNKGNGKSSQWMGRADYISAKKYQKDALRADNIELVSDRPLSLNEPEDSEYNVKNRMKIWEVKYVYKMELPKVEPLVTMILGLDDYKKNWQYKVIEIEVERETENNYFVKPHHPVTYKSQIPKIELGEVHNHYSKNFIIGTMDKYNEMELQLFKAVEERQENKIEAAEQLQRQEEKNLELFRALKEKQGY